MTVPVDAVNYCHAPALYRYQLSAAQTRCNINSTTELVLHVDADGHIIEQRLITANTELPVLVRNTWR